jgi:hypothetical protein
MLRTSITIDRTKFFLAQGADPATLRAEMIQAIRSGGGFVRFVEVGNRAVTVLTSPGVAVIFEEAEVDVDDRDTGDEGHQFLAPHDADRRIVDYGFDFLD